MPNKSLKPARGAHWTPSTGAASYVRAGSARSALCAPSCRLARRQALPSEKTMDRINMRKFFVGIILSIFCTGCSVAEEPYGSGEFIYPLNLKVSAQRIDRSPEENTFYLFTLNCGLGACSFGMMEVNKCIPMKNGEKSFTPEYRNWTTWSGSLSVSQIKQNELSIVAYQTTHKSFPMKFKVIYSTSKRDPREDQKVMAFEGHGIFDGSNFPQEINFFSVSAVKGSQRLAVLNCPLLLKGVPNG